MSLDRRPLLLLACCLWSLSVHAQGPPADPPGPPAPPLELELDETGVSIGNVTPGGPVALVLVERGLRGMGGSTVYGTLILADDDGDGTVRFEHERGVPALSHWLAVDLTTGEAAQVNPEGFSPRIRQLPEQALERGGAGRLNRLRRQGGLFYTVLVRAGDEATRGAWQTLVEDGAATDADGRGDGSVLFSPETAEPIDASPPPPDTFADGDLLVLVHPRSLELSLVRVRETGPPGTDPETDEEGA